MGAAEYALLIILVIAIPLAIAGAVTLWSLKQVRYQPKKRGPRVGAPEGSAAEPSDNRPNLESG
ncbi:MAG: hypothetical protein H0V24_04800 [Chloroflexia bacterium]|nr:hypothetical protein [Chloroflexia bacterium]